MRGSREECRVAQAAFNRIARCSENNKDIEIVQDFLRHAERLVPSELDWDRRTKRFVPRKKRTA